MSGGQSLFRIDLIAKRKLMYVLYLYCIFQLMDQALAVADSQALSAEPG